VAAFNEGVKSDRECFVDFGIPYEKGQVKKDLKTYLDAVGGVDAKGWKKRGVHYLPQ
jgi:hypothetical protein